MELTDSQVRNAQPKEAPYKLRDGHGLHLLIKPNGSKLWQGRYEFGPDKTERVMSYGAYPSTTISKAREAHDQTRKDLANGLDPMQAKKFRQQEAEEEARRAQIAATVIKPFRRTATDYFAHWKKGKSGAYVDKQEMRLERDILPVLGDLEIASITPAQISALALEMEKLGPSVARYNLSFINQTFRYAIRREICTQNPAAAFRPGDILQPEVHENFPRVSQNDLPGLLKKMDSYKGKTPRVMLCMRMLSLVFTRPTELLEAQWPEINFRAARWDIPKERMKAPEGKRTPHIVPLSAQALATLTELWELRKDDKWVFPAHYAGAERISIHTLGAAWGIMGYRHEMTSHGFRGVASTWLYEQGIYESDWIEAQLHHAPKDKVKGAYNWAQYLPHRKKMMQDWADHLDELRTLKTTSDGEGRMVLGPVQEEEREEQPPEHELGPVLVPASRTVIFGEASSFGHIPAGDLNDAPVDLVTNDHFDDQSSRGAVPPAGAAAEADHHSAKESNTPDEDVPLFHSDNYSTGRVQEVDETPEADDVPPLSEPQTGDTAENDANGNGRPELEASVGVLLVPASLASRYDRQELYDRVWSVPIWRLRKEYGVSNVALAKTCKRLHVPVPGRGYWAMLAAGKPTQPRPPLPSVELVERLAS